MLLSFLLTGLNFRKREVVVIMTESLNTSFMEILDSKF
jgi:hypothetical protein